MRNLISPNLIWFKRLYGFILALFLLIACISCNSDEEPEVIIENQVLDILLFSKNPNGYNELYKFENGVESPILSNPDFDYWWPKVSPDKKTMLVYRSVADPSKNHDNFPNAELVLCNIDGTNPKVIINKNKYGWVSQGVCRWNKDGTKILMAAEINVNESVQWRLVITDTNGNQPKILSDNWAIDCNFSVDNEHIYFIGFENNILITDPTKFELQQGDFDDVNDTITNIVSLTSNSTKDHDPDISPDNAKIISQQEMRSTAMLIWYCMILRPSRKLFCWMMRRQTGVACAGHQTVKHLFSQSQSIQISFRNQKNRCSYWYEFYCVKV